MEIEGVKELSIAGSLTAGCKRPLLSHLGGDSKIGAHWAESGNLVPGHKKLGRLIPAL